ncbi:MAG: DUF488 family protein [Bradymonadaceae bacterium]
MGMENGEPGTGAASETIYTLGHSNRDLEPFVALLEEADIGALADIRTYPSSRRFPWFNEGNLADSLEERGIRYRHIDALGGLRDEPEPDGTIEVVPEKWKPYAAHMQTGEFAKGIEALIDLVDRHGPAAYMCAERDPRQCHRQFVSDVLALQGWEVVHLIRGGESRVHEVRTDARETEDGRVVYPSEQRELPL